MVKHIHLSNGAAAGLAATICLLAAPTQARADLLTVWAAGKTATTGATGLIGDRWDGGLGYGVEGGVETLGIDLFGEALLFAPDQYYFTANLGFDLSFGEDFRFGLGAFTGPLIYVLPEPGSISGFDRNSLPPQTQQLIGVPVLDTISTEYRKLADKEEAAGRTLFGWNARARLTLEYQLIPMVFLGAEGGAGYHYVLSGEEEAAKAKKALIEAQRAKLPPEARDNDQITQAYDDLGHAIGADKKVEGDKAGVNWDAGVFLKLEL